MALELLNEPKDSATTEVINPIFTETIRQIRQIAPKRTIFVGPGRWNSIAELPKLRLPDDDQNLIVTVHNYEPFYFTHHGADWAGPDTKVTGILFPGPPSRPFVPDPNLKVNSSVINWIKSYNTEPSTSNPSSPLAFQGTLDQAKEWSEYYGRPVHIGEFGCYTKADPARALITTVRFVNWLRKRGSAGSSGIGKLAFITGTRKPESPSPECTKHCSASVIPYNESTHERFSLMTSPSAKPLQDSSHKTNRLAGETSPYLLQHATNPVDWYPWGTEALARSKAENKPIFLSIGYSACHWCHVMERESFENPEIAALMNEHFVNIKVDREERPDLDQIYMSAVMAMTGHGGWPMSVFLTPELKPFFGGTYFPPSDSRGMAGFPRVLASVHQAWQERREEIIESAAEMTRAITRIRHGSRGLGLARRQAARSGCSHHDARLRPAPWRLRPRPQVSPPDGPQGTVASSHANRRQPGPAHRPAHARQDGPRRHLRPPGGRLCPLLDRRPLAGSPLRENALRQRTLNIGLSRGLSVDP